MTQFGKTSCIYMQKELVILGEKAIKTFPEKFKSMSNLVNAALFRYLRELKIDKNEVKHDRISTNEG